MSNPRSREDPFLDPPGPLPVFGRPRSPEKDCDSGRQSIMTPRPPGPPGAHTVFSAHPLQQPPYVFPQHLYALPPPPYIPPPALSPTLHPLGVLLPPGTTSPPSATSDFLGIPKLVCGDDIGFDVPTGQRCCNCAIASHYTGSSHCGFECPLRYWARYQGCPGWTVAGHRIPAAWSGPNLTRQTRADWVAFIAKHTLPTVPTAQAMAGAVVAF